MTPQTFTTVLEDWRARCPHPKLRHPGELAAAWVLWAAGGALALCGLLPAAVFVWAVVLAAYGTPWPPVLPTVRMIRAVRAEAQKREATP